MPTSSRRPRFRGWGVVLTTLVVAAACQSSPPDGQPSTAPTDGAAADGDPGTQVAVPDPDDIDPGRLEPLLRFGECPEVPPGDPDADTGGVPLPPEAVVDVASLDGSLRNVQGYSPRTPVEIMVAYLREEDVTAVNVEDEVFESEVLLERGPMRVFIKAQAVCARGSRFVLFASEDDALVPRPANAPQPSG